MRIIYSFDKEDSFKLELEITEKLSNGLYTILPINHRKALKWASDISPWDLDKLYREKNQNLLSFYDHIYNLAKNADVFYVDHNCVYHPDFILELSKIIYTVICSGDDPESSYYRSKPYMYSFDHAFCYGVYYNEIQKMTDKYLEWGAKKADFRPYGCMSASYNHDLDENEILNKDRDIDIIFVGGMANKNRDEFLLKLKKYFGKRFVIYGFWGGYLGLFSRIKKGYGLNLIRKITKEEYLKLYKRAKIGINIHQSYGPCNLRLYELPMNGIMQICDNKKGLNEIFHVGKEVVGYDCFTEAVDLINHYLENDKERKQIALNGYKKVKENYLFHETFYQSMEKIKIGIIEKMNRV